ncbi:MAG: hypothetical protein WC157_02715 [Candidatus Paceibacterota bacterium]
MAKGFKIKPSKLKKKEAKGIEPTSPSDANIIFSFDKLKEDNGFKYRHCKVNYFFKLLERLRDISGMTRADMERNRDALKYHPINFLKDDVTRRTFGYEEELDENAYQFSISANEHGRVHGFFINNKFYIVWLDPNHCLYKGARK